MKITHKDLKAGIVKIAVENAEDLWYLSSLVEPGDFVSGKTFRKIKVGGGNDERAKDSAKKAVHLKIKVEKVEFFQNLLRVLGIIVDGPDDVPRGEHHTFNVEENTRIEIQKEEWLKYQIDKLMDASIEKPSKILIVVFDREEAYFALMKKYGFELLMHIEGDVQKKDDATKAKGNFYAEIIEKIKTYDERMGLSSIVLASPAFWKDELSKELKDEELSKKILFATCSSATKSAINEVLKREEVKTALHNDRVVREMNFVEDLLREISKNGQASYGMNDVFNAAISGAVNTLLVSDNLIQKSRDEGNYKRVEEIMKKTESGRGTVVIISSEHEGGRKLDGLGGIGAILRYKMSY